MSSERTVRVTEKIRASLEARDYGAFVDLFAADGVYELPFALPGSVARYDGVSRIRERFEAIGNSPVNRLYDLHRVKAEIHETVDPDVAVIELSIEGTLHSNGAPIECQSSIAVISFDGDTIKRYRDYPNSAGIAHAMGLLAQYAASLGK